ncbi:class I SAM-dependent methyltransferase [Streptomyces boncukensis]|uniref:Class I SAM-dependent methyltransferase n=1 Tax=Streptomyces boncukensis TaxID=2711219 RepID=A0A6G4WR26_9ACTN|nr:class I SAM-dependent methyltransferase [Streptomyces boncukensis]NGO67716.1 class I SAM-dependent methyltransferase [Streptomyces boncukensis]
MPAASRGALIAALRPDYQAELAGGTDRFFLPRAAGCPWCRSDRRPRQRLRTRDWVQGKPGAFVLDQCRDCGHTFQNPRLSEEGLDFYYRDFYDGLGAESTAKMFEAGGSQKRFRRSARALREHAAPGRWLDVGTAHAHFCAAARRLLPDTEFHGLDQGESVEHAVKEGRITRAYRGRLTELADELADRYDVLSMFHYLEHTPDPGAELAAAHTALRPGGHLLIEVPNPESPFSRLLGRRWMPWFQPQHLHFVPLGNLRVELERLGFTVVAASVRGDQHIPVDLVCATWFWLNPLLPAEDQPWLPRPPGRAARVARGALALAALPLILLAYGLDLLLAPLVRRTRFSNAYRVIARRG